jgi:hypothetical protein
VLRSWDRAYIDQRVHVASAQYFDEFTYWHRRVPNRVYCRSREGQTANNS